MGNNVRICRRDDLRARLFNFFGIPTYLISLTPSVIFRGVVGIAAVIILSIPVVSLLERLLRIVPSTDLRFRLIIAVLMWAGFALVFGLSWQSDLVAYGLIAWIVASFLRTLWKARGSVGDRFRAALRADLEEQEDGPVMKAIERRFGVAPILLAILMYLIAMVAYVVGSAVARLQSDFYVLDSLPNVAIVRMHSDLLIGFEFDAESRRVTGKYVVNRIGETEQGEVRTAKLGWLSQTVKPGTASGGGAASQ